MSRDGWQVCCPSFSCSFWIMSEFPIFWWEILCEVRSFALGNAKAKLKMRGLSPRRFYKHGAPPCTECQTRKGVPRAQSHPSWHSIWKLRWYYLTLSKLMKVPQKTAIPQIPLALHFRMQRYNISSTWASERTKNIFPMVLVGVPPVGSKLFVRAGKCP